MQVHDFVHAIESIAPPALAEPWDNVGLLVGARDWPAGRVLLTIDLTREVLEEAVRAKHRLICAYHPPIFTPLTQVTDASEKSAIILGAASETVAVYSPHTALDATTGGVNDWLAESCGEGTARPIAPHVEAPASESHKLITFCPPSATDAIRRALAGAGAGRIGDYDQCSFESDGHGTFRGGDGTNPVVGSPGRLERTEEIRLEMVTSAGALPAVIAALRASHPYEEPAFEIHALAGRADAARGAGRVIRLASPVSLDALVHRLKSRLRVDHLHVATGRTRARTVRTVGVCAGAGSSLAAGAISQGAQVLVTGEMSHHDVLAAQAEGVTVILAGHTNTERGYLPVLKRRLRKALPKCTIAISRRDRDPLRLV